MRQSFFAATNLETKGGKTTVRTMGNYWGILGGKFALVRIRGSYLEVDLGDIPHKSATRGNWWRWGVAPSFTER